MNDAMTIVMDIETKKKIKKIAIDKGKTVAGMFEEWVKTL